MSQPLHLLVGFGVGEHVSRPPALACCVQQLQQPAGTSCLLYYNVCTTVTARSFPWLLCVTTAGFPWQDVACSRLYMWMCHNAFHQLVTLTQTTAQTSVAM